ncbi:hypothetical protein Nepgr_008492 [Nepenthes gracilis]|uniref:Uncharacterized protein n=1 Tax=Nepenthes gracilis TaxID=150966 RepID=A0AAD3S910_NEPGR|nr:hypothetical protein Nepgr_008492 [Nepenthes gracilis]
MRYQMVSGHGIALKGTWDERRGVPLKEHKLFPPRVKGPALVEQPHWESTTRNGVLQVDGHEESTPIHRVFKMASQLNRIDLLYFLTSLRIPIDRNLKWIPPPENECKINVDDCVGANKTTSCGEVGWDSRGQWVFGFAGILGRVKIVQAELDVILWEL